MPVTGSQEFFSNLRIAAPQRVVGLTVMFCLAEHYFVDAKPARHKKAALGRVQGRAEN